jgi:RNA polymerase sigma-70 factor (ECF subfamily)
MGESFEDVFRTEFAPLHSWLHRRLGAAGADELAAQTFEIAFRRWDDLEPGRPARPWLYGIAANLARHHWRKERRMLRAHARSGIEPAPNEDEAALHERLDAQAQTRALAAALAELRAEEREVLLLHAWAGLSDSEIAEALSLPVGTVKSRLHRSREHLRNHLSRIGQLEMRTQMGTVGEKT